MQIWYLFFLRFVHNFLQYISYIFSDYMTSFRIIAFKHFSRRQLNTTIYARDVKTPNFFGPARPVVPFLARPGP